MTLSSTSPATSEFQLGYGGVIICRYALYPIERDELPGLWDRIQADFELTILDINDRDYNGETIYDNIINGTFTLFAVIDVEANHICGFITIVIEGQTLHLHDGDKTSKWITVNHGFLYRDSPLNTTMLDDGLLQIEAAGREQGCGSIRIKGRLGWSKWFRKRGYNTHMIMMEKPIIDV